MRLLWLTTVGLFYYRNKIHTLRFVFIERIIFIVKTRINIIKIFECWQNVPSANISCPLDPNINMNK